jgi:hypothetical protein
MASTEACGYAGGIVVARKRDKIIVNVLTVFYL